MKAVMDLVAVTAEQDVTVLITGESGTGKELVAKAIHEASVRCNHPFVGVNCAALPEALLESELFGHEKGSFTGAHQQRLGKFELAQGGTLFLDEIGDMSPAIQAKVLRVLQERTFERVGGNKSLKADVRVVSATHRDLRKMIRDGAFREDLYYRLNIVPIRVPPLRERMEDLPLLVGHFLAHFNEHYNKHVGGVLDSVLERFQLHDWPGNIRELRNLLERAVVLSGGGLIAEEHLLEALHGPAPDATEDDTNLATGTLDRSDVEF